ncbi:MAG: response regulator [Desulfuromonadales bacterium]
MLIDDEEFILDSMQMYLEDMGFIAAAYSVPHEALQAIEKNPPDVCIVDLRMPGMNGEDLVKEIHKIAPSVRLMILTGTLYDIPEELETLGMSQEDVVQKPIHDYPEFFRKIACLS